MSPSATINSRFSTPGGRSPNLTPPEIETGPVLFEKANNVIWSCPDGLAHALNEQNIRLQQIIFEHRVSDHFRRMASALKRLIGVLIYY